VYRSHGSVTLDKQTSDLCVDDHLSFGTSGDGVHVHEKWEVHHSDQANTLQVSPSTNVCQINQSWKQEELFTRSLRRTVIGTSVKFTSRGNAVLSTDYQHTEVAQYASWPNVGQKQLKFT
jgi:hypothetical protein